MQVSTTERGLSQARPAEEGRRERTRRATVQSPGPALRPARGTLSGEATLHHAGYV